MILFNNVQNIIEIDNNIKSKLIEILECALKEEGVDIPYEVSILFTDNEYIKKLNCEYRKIDKETDVLSFPMLEYTEGKVYKDIYKDYIFKNEDLDDKKLVLGDIVISLEKACEQSMEYGHSFLREVSYLAVHSILHLLGYDHIREDDKACMREREEYILSKFSVIR